MLNTKQVFKVYFLLGSNLGNRLGNLEKAIFSLQERVGEVVSKSSIYETEPWGFSHENSFLNLALEIDTTLTPDAILDEIITIEAELGRKREGTGYTGRLIDIDIILYEDMVMKTDRLTIPHALMQERKFVLEPLNEIAATVVHPVFGKTIFELLQETQDNHQISKPEDIKKAGN